MPPAALRGLSEGPYAGSTKGRRPLDPLKPFGHYVVADLWELVMNCFL